MPVAKCVESQDGATGRQFHHIFYHGLEESDVREHIMARSRIITNEERNSWSNSWIARCSMQVNCSHNVRAAHIYRDSSAVLMYRTKRSSLSARFSDTALFPRRKRNTSHGERQPIALACLFGMVYPANLFLFGNRKIKECKWCGMHQRASINADVSPMWHAIQ